jgi:transposase
LFPEDLRERLPEDHPVHFIIEAIEGLDVRGFKVNTTGSGSEQYPPAMKVMPLLYCYATGRMSSRVIEEATYTDVGVRYICGNQAHPDHTVICRFRTEDREAFKKLFSELLVMARQMGYLKRQEAERDGRIGIRDNKTGDGVSAISAAWVGKGKSGMGDCVPWV